MNCLSEELIQMYIDGELPERERLQVAVHIKDCEKCAYRMLEQKELSRVCKASINSLKMGQTIIPDFIKPISGTRFSRKLWRRFIYPLAAASILFLFLSLPLKRNSTGSSDFIILGSFSGEIDANLPISEQDIEIIMYNENGYTIE